LFSEGTVIALYRVNLTKRRTKIMQDVQNIPNPDVNSTQTDDDFGSHSDYPNTDVEQPKEDIPVPNDRERNAPVEEPPAEDGEEEPRRIV